MVSISLVATGCSNDSSSNSDASVDAAADMAFFSDCGRPGDVGNNLGVGKFCTTAAECQGLTATLCTHLYRSVTGENTSMCTVANCTNDSQCGTNASCQCRALGCGCVPNACVSAIPQG